MNLQEALPIINQLVGKDLTKELTLFYRARSAVGTSLLKDEQTVFIEHWPSIVDFMETREGQVAIYSFLSEWLETLKSKPTPPIEEIPDETGTTTTVLPSVEHEELVG
jgi:hypothetical protein